MTGDEYLEGILKKYEVNTKEAEKAGNLLYPLIVRWSNNYLVKAEFSGSLAKGTPINIGTDADIFISLSSALPDTLSQIYSTLFTAVTQAGYIARKQNVSIGLTVNGYKIDLVPGKRQSQYGNDHSLFKSKINSYTKTNIHKHINYVKNSGRISEIKLAKIWAKLHNLDFPSFYLEMVVIDALKYATIGNTSNNFLKVLEFLRDELEAIRYIDPANTNNIISNDLTPTEKRIIATKARISRSQNNWNNIIW